jgi:lycopene cyclase domain-containing protein
VAVDHYQYFLVLGGCLAVTLPLEVVAGARVYRRPLRTVRALLRGAVPFVALDAAASVAHLWTYNPRYVAGWRPAFGLPVEEYLFFIVVPLCALLTFDALEHLLAQRGELDG